MRKHVVTILMLCLAAMPLAAQQWTSEQLAQANTARDASYLSEQEKQVVFLCNLARMDGALFAATYLAQHTPNDPSNWYIASLYRDLQTVKDRQLLYPDKRLYATAAYHAADMDAPDVPATQAPTEPTLPTVCMAVWVKKRSLPKTARTATTTMWR